jgi:glycosyltransferase involved in cell wall biosynthesis
MTLALICLGIFTLVGLSAWLPPLWPVRKIIACAAIIGLSISTGMVFGLHPSPWSAAVLVLGIYQLLNLLRLVEDRTEAKYLYIVSFNTSVWLICSQAVILLAALLNNYAGIPTLGWWYAVAAGQIGVAYLLFMATRRSLRTTKAPSISNKLADRDLPTVSVAIPARNETDDLEACLQSLTASNYPKLEIIVLDDCSQNKRTPEIIRGFAHDGVKFINGQAPAEHWLAKNYAYQQLSQAANGDLLVFCGVDTRFEPNSLHQMVELHIQKDKQMLSLIPENQLPGGGKLEDLMVQPGRYAWELALPRRKLNRPPVLSTCWIITSAAFKKAGTFKAVARSASPESYFARQCIGQGDGYAFVASNKTIGLRSLKSLAEQRATAIRTRYPQVHRRPELVAFLSLSEFLLLVAPFIGVVVALAHSQWIIAGLFAISCLLLTALYGRIVGLTYRRFLWRGTWLLPFAVIYDIALLNYSMWRYEFRDVIWKDRNVCVPLMRVIPAFPKLKQS